MTLRWKILRMLAKRRQVRWVLADYSPWRSHWKCWRVTSDKQARKQARAWINVHQLGQATVHNARPTWQERGKKDFDQTGTWVSTSSGWYSAPRKNRFEQ